MYGTHAWSRPSFERFRELSPEYGYLAQGIEERRGVTQFDFTNDRDGDRVLDAAGVALRKNISVESVYRYRTRGSMPAPDFYEGRSPRWRESTIDGWKRPGRGAGGGRPSTR